MGSALADAGPPEYVHSRLWRESLGPDAESAHPLERSRLSKALDSTRANVLPMVAQIGQDLPDFTIHDEDHLDALWLLADVIGGDGVHFNPAEGFVFGVAVLLHDLGLAVAAYPGGLTELRAQPEWRDALGIVLRRSLRRAPTSGELDAPGDSDAVAADRVVLRERHARRAVDLAQVGFRSGDEETFLVEDEELRRCFAWLAGQLAASHWWPVSELRTLADIRMAAAELPHEWEVDALKLAVLLRLADYSHLDSRRAPGLRRLLQDPQGESLLHWDFQERLARAGVQGSRLRYQSTVPFGRDESHAWWLAADVLAAVDRELRDVDALLQDLDRPLLAVKGVLGAGDPKRLRESVLTTGWEPVDAHLTVSDVTQLVRRLGGAQLYGSKADVPIREMIQNAADAIEARRRVQPDWASGSVVVSIRERGEWLAVEVRDDGVGMAPEILCGPLLDFGRSLWRESAVTRLLPGLAGSDFEPVGQFGIGFFSVFMFDRPVRVRSRFHTSAMDQTYVLDFPGGLSRRALLRRAEVSERMAEPGTVVSFEVRDPDRGTEPSLLRTQPAIALGRLCPTLGVDLRVIDGDASTSALRGNDWFDLSAAELVKRIGADATPAQLARMRPLYDADGRIVGRLAAIPAVLYLSGGEPGVLTVGGFAAQRRGSMVGVLIGGEPNLARSEATALVSAEEFARWATQQAELWVDAGLDIEDSIGVAAAIARYGGDVGDLPVCYGRDGPMSRAELADWARDRERIILWEHIDQDELRVPGGVDPTFHPGEDTLVIDPPVRSSDLGETVSLTSPEVALTDLVCATIADAWVQSTEALMSNSGPTNDEVIGESEVDDIFSSTALVFERVTDK